MANRKIAIETKVEVMEKCLHIVDVKKIAEQYGASVGSIYYWYNHKIKPSLGDVLENTNPGPEPESNIVEEISEPDPEERPASVFDNIKQGHLTKF